jgi:hypothetical protein
MLKARSPFRALAKHPAISPPPPSRAGTSFPPCCGNPVISFYARYAAALFVDQLNSVPSTHMRCRTTASLRATATVAFRSPLRGKPHPRRLQRFGTRVSSIHTAKGTLSLKWDKGRDRRPAFDKLCRDAARREFTESLGACERPFHRLTTLHAREISTADFVLVKLRALQ